MGERKKARSGNFGLSNTVPLIAGTTNSEYFLHYFPANCNAGGKKKLELVQICCRQCGIYFAICRKCFRGEAYCSDSCRNKGYQRLHRDAQKRYREKKKGKQKHRQAERRRRWKLWENNQKKEYNINNRKKIAKSLKQSKTHFVKEAVLKMKKRVGENTHCHFCGQEGIIVKKFPRRGY